MRETTMRVRWRLAALAVALGFVTACGGATPEPSLYDRLGGVEGIRPVVDSTVANVAGDERINAFFAGLDEAKAAVLKDHLVNLLCRETGGGCTYTGRDMRTAHAGLELTEANFEALLEDVAKALDEHGVPQAEKDEMLGVLGRMRNDVLGR